MMIAYLGGASQADAQRTHKGGLSSAWAPWTGRVMRTFVYASIPHSWKLGSRGDWQWITGYLHHDAVCTWEDHFFCLTQLLWGDNKRVMWSNSEKEKESCIMSLPITHHWDQAPNSTVVLEW